MNKIIEQLNTEQCDFQKEDAFKHLLWSLLVGGGFSASLQWGPSLVLRKNPEILELSNIFSACYQILPSYRFY